MFSRQAGKGQFYDYGKCVIKATIYALRGFGTANEQLPLMM